MRNISHQQPSSGDDRELRDILGRVKYIGRPLSAEELVSEVADIVHETRGKNTDDWLETLLKRRRDTATPENLVPQAQLERRFLSTPGKRKAAKPRTSRKNKNG